MVSNHPRMGKIRVCKKLGGKKEDKKFLILGMEEIQHKMEHAGIFKNK